jgi:hypothetical protein
MKELHYYPNLKGQRKNGWFSAWTKPKGKFWKRNANKKVRKQNIPDGKSYKKTWGWFEWC